MKALPCLPASARATSREGGVSLVELMVAITIGMFLILVVTTVFTNTSRSHAELQRNATQIENGRYALEVLSEEIQMAGFWGSYATASDTPTLPLMCETATANLGWNVATLSIPVPIFGYDGAAVPVGETCLGDRHVPAAGPVPDVITVRRVSTVPLTTAAIDGSAFLQISNCNTDPSATPFVLSEAAGDFTLNERNCTTRENLRRYQTRTFYIATCSNCPSADGLPSLRVAELDGPSKTIRNATLVEGIENLKIEYGLDNDFDGQVDLYSTCAGATPCDAAAWRNVVTVRLHVLSRASEASPGHVDQKTYDLGAAGTAGPFNDGFKRHVYTAVVRAENPAGRRERP